MGDMNDVIQPKVDQLTADHLLGTTKTITITSVDVRVGADQPVNIHYEGENGLPYRPCKSMARAMVDAWGADSKQYVGKSMTLYRDPKVKWGGMEIGGIRISHMSHIDRERVLALTEKKGSKKPFIVKPLVVEAPKPSEDTAAVMAGELIAAIDAASDLGALENITGSARCVKLRARLAEARPELAAKVDEAVSARLADFSEAESIVEGV